MDLNVQAFRLVQDATKEPDAKKASQTIKARKAGLKGGRLRALKLSPERRLEIARQANEARWTKK